MLLLCAACGDMLLHPAAPAAAHIAVAPLFQLGPESAQAYAKLDNIVVRFFDVEDLYHEAESAFDPSGSETRVPVAVPLRNASETLTLEVLLRIGTQGLFSGSGRVTLSAGSTSEIEIELFPIISSLSCDGPVVQFSSYGDTELLTAAALLASGDAVAGIPVTWSSANGAIASVNGSGVVTALQDGTTQVECRSGQLSDARSVAVFAVVNSIQVAPPSATISVAATQPFLATLRDARNNPITGRQVTWSSLTSAVASVNTGTGVAQGLSPGTSTIRATSGSVFGGATLTVSIPPPLAMTGAATSVGFTTAVFNGSINPNGSASTAWFDWGTTPTLPPALSTRTALAPPGGGSNAVPYAVGFGDLLPGVTYYYRIGGSNGGGTTLGNIVQFTTSAFGPPSVRNIGAEWVGPDFAFQMTGGVKPNGFETRAWFEWSLLPSMPDAKATPPQAIPAGTVEVQIVDFAFVPCGPDIYFRVAAFNDASGGIITRSTPSVVGPPPGCSPSPATVTPMKSRR
jgi:hypothetical protein